MARLGRGDERLHERGADAPALMRRRHADRCDAGHGARRAVEAAWCRQRVGHHRAGFIGDQLDERRGPAGGPRPVDDGELLAGVAGVVGEGRADHGEDLRFVSRSHGGAHERVHGSLTPTLTMWWSERSPAGTTAGRRATRPRTKSQSRRMGTWSGRPPPSCSVVGAATLASIQL